MQETIFSLCVEANNLKWNSCTFRKKQAYIISAQTHTHKHTYILVQRFFQIVLRYVNLQKDWALLLSAGFKYFCVYYFICKHTANKIRHKCLLRIAQKYSP